jgi:hypothetical protein
MVWTKLDDHFWSNPKMIGLTDRAYRLYVNGLNWSVAHLTDGMLHESHLSILIPNTGLSATKRAVNELETAHLWLRVPLGFEINDFAEYQFTKDEWEARSESFRKRSKQGVHARWHKQKPDPTCPTCRDNLSDAKRDANKHTKSDAPAQPDPTLSSSSDAEFKTFNLKRAEWAVETKRSRGDKIKSPGGLAKTIADDPAHIAESVRQWAHRDCPECGGTGFTSEYAPGAGNVRIECVL